MVNEMFHLKIGGGNLEAARNAAWQAGYTENGFGYLPKLTGELTVVVGIVILMLVILGIGLWRISSIGKSDLPGKMLSLEQENARLQKELKLEHTYNENQKKQLQDFIENIAHQVKTPLT
ncbi:MAG: sensor histidine kinase, partial [Lachnospira sp.]|nr:sensor histidine kinase [Lachnospira sp.]